MNDLGSVMVVIAVLVSIPSEGWVEVRAMSVVVVTMCVIVGIVMVSVVINIVNIVVFKEEELSHVLDELILWVLLWWVITVVRLITG